MGITLEILAAECEINRVLRRYCRSMDRIDAKLGYSVWHEDGLADYGELFNGTGRGLIDWALGFHATLESHSHQIGNVLVDVRGDKAASETYFTGGLLARPDEAGKQSLTTARARYLDEWSRRDGVWAIDRRCCVVCFAVTQEVQRVPLPLPARDSSDPSYALLGTLGRA
jgi:hypothetical protein